MRRLLAAVCVLVIGSAIVSGNKPAEQLTVWVLTLMEGAQSNVGDSYTTRAQAVAAAQGIQSDSVWVKVDPSGLQIPSPRKGFPAWWDKLSMLDPVAGLHAQTTLTATEAVVLPTFPRQGEFVSPAVSRGAATWVGGSVQMSDEDLLNPVTELTLRAEDPSGNLVCGAQFFGPAPIHPDTGRPAPPAMRCRVGAAVTQVQVRVKTCNTANPLCVPLLLTVGSTVDLFQ